jgi:anti-sigma28 factor (negative regulator of flagellin synthesis)
VKIDSSDLHIRDTRPINRAQQVEAETLNSADSASVEDCSLDNAEIGSVAQRLLAASSSTESKIQDLRKLFESGAYKPDASKVSQKLVDSLLE